MTKIDLKKVALTSERLEELHEAERAAWRARQPTCELCNGITGRPRKLHCTTCGDVYLFCRTCIAEPAGDVHCGPCADAYESALED